MVESQEWVSVYIASGKLAAEMIRLRLESFGITTNLAQESVGSVYGLTVGPLGEVQILVPARQSAQALEIIHAIEMGIFEQGDEEGGENKDKGDDNLTKT